MAKNRGNLRKKPSAFAGHKLDRLASLLESYTSMLTLNEEKLREPERLKEKIDLLKKKHPEFICVAEIAEMCLSSSATNDFLEKIGAEAIGAKHLTDKLGPDGREANGKGCEVKPCKKSSGSKNIGVINDDTPMKLLETHLNYGTLVAINATKDGSRINWALACPFSSFEEARFKAIVKKLALLKDSTWKWGEEYPKDTTTQLTCLNDLVTRHKSGTYVRSSQLSLDSLKDIPRDHLVLWKHPEVDQKKLPALLRTL